MSGNRINKQKLLQKQNKQIKETQQKNTENI